MTTSETPAWINWIRPWYPAGAIGHIYPDCPELLRVEPDPREGAGWLDPTKGHICRPCARRHGFPEWNAICDICDASMSEDWEDDNENSLFTKTDAEQWKQEHRCEPSIRIIPPTTSKPRKAAA